MSRDRDRAGTKTPVPEKPDGKLPYQKPILRSEGVFETMALACGKLNTTQAQCKTQLKTS